MTLSFACWLQTIVFRYSSQLMLCAQSNPVNASSSREVFVISYRLFVTSCCILPRANAKRRCYHSSSRCSCKCARTTSRSGSLCFVSFWLNLEQMSVHSCLNTDWFTRSSTISLSLIESIGNCSLLFELLFELSFFDIVRPVSMLVTRREIVCIKLLTTIISPQVRSYQPTIHCVRQSRPINHIDQTNDNRAQGRLQVDTQRRVLRCIAARADDVLLLLASHNLYARQAPLRRSLLGTLCFAAVLLFMVFT